MIAYLPHLFVLVLAGGFLFHGHRQNRINAEGDAITKALKDKEDSFRNDPRLSKHRAMRRSRSTPQ